MYFKRDFPLTFVGVFRTNEHIIVRPPVLAQLSQRVSDVIVHRDIAWSSVLGIARCNDVAKEIHLVALHPQLLAHTHACAECSNYGWLQVSTWPTEVCRDAQ